MEKVTVVDRIINTILHNIEIGEYKQGEKIPNEFVLMSEMAVSRNSLREAMKMLSCMGIVEIKRGNGTFICEKKEEVKEEIKQEPKVVEQVEDDIWENVSFNEILEYRQNIDEMIARFAMGNITRDDIAWVEENVQDIKIAIDEEDFKRVRELDFEFHEMLIKLSKNELFIKNTLSVYKKFFEFEEKIFGNKSVNPIMTYCHKKLVVCIAKKDDFAIKKAVENTLSEWREYIL